MLCLYCDRPLALLKRLTGDGEFCSKEHRKIYQQEHNQLGLARLLEAQPTPTTKGKRPVIHQNESPAPAEAPPVAKKAERQPGQAGFIPDFVPDAIAVSVADRSTAGPRFQGAAPILAESKSAQGPEDRSQRPLPKLATFLSESSALLFAGEVRFPGTSGVEPLAGRPRLGKSHSEAAGVTIRLQPFDAGFILGQPVAPKSSPAFGSDTAARSTGPRFSPLVPAKACYGMSRSGSDPKLPWRRSSPRRPSARDRFPRGFEALPPSRAGNLWRLPFPHGPAGRLFWFSDPFCAGRFGSPTWTAYRRVSKFDCGPSLFLGIRREWVSSKNGLAGSIASGSLPPSAFLLRTAWSHQYA